MNVSGGTPVAPVRTEKLAVLGARFAGMPPVVTGQSKNRNSKDMKKARKVQAYLARESRSLERAPVHRSGVAAQRR